MRGDRWRYLVVVTLFRNSVCKPLSPTIAIRARNSCFHFYEHAIPNCFPRNVYWKFSFTTRISKFRLIVGRLRKDHNIILVFQIYAMKKKTVKNMLPMKRYVFWSFPLSVKWYLKLMSITLFNTTYLIKYYLFIILFKPYYNNEFITLIIG